MTANRNTPFLYTQEDIVRLIIQDINAREGTSYTTEQLRVQTTENGNYHLGVLEEGMPPFFEARTRQQILELLTWAIANDRVIEFVYERSTRERNDRSRRHSGGSGGIETTARIATAYHMDERYLLTYCHATLRNNRLEYTNSEDNKRTFLLDNIKTVRLSEI